MKSVQDVCIFLALQSAKDNLQQDCSENRNKGPIISFIPIY